MMMVNGAPLPDGRKNPCSSHHAYSDSSTCDGSYAGAISSADRSLPVLSVVIASPQSPLDRITMGRRQQKAPPRRGTGGFAASTFEARQPPLVTTTSQSLTPRW